MEIKKVTLGLLSSPVKTGIIENHKTLYRLYRVPDSIRVKICLIDNDMAIEVDDFDTLYPIITRDELGRLTDDQVINEDTTYALDIEPVEQYVAKTYKKKIKEYKKLNN